MHQLYLLFDIVGWPLLFLWQFFHPLVTTGNSFMISLVQTSIIARARSDPSSFCHPCLSDDEMKQGCKLGIDSWADTCCAGKHCYVEEFVEGKVVHATGFTPSLGSMQNLPIAHVLYAHDAMDGGVIIL